MRAFRLVAGFVLAAAPLVTAADTLAQTAKGAASEHAVTPPPARPLIIRIPPAQHPPAAELPLRLEPYRPVSSDPLGASALSIGPLKARLGGGSRKAHIARYKLEGMDVLGGSVSGTLDSRGARVYLRWPPRDDDE